jgi:hypothetical protein
MKGYMYCPASIREDLLYRKGYHNYLSLLKKMYQIGYV